MNKTFVQETIRGRQYQFLTLPGSDLFQFEIVNKLGAHVERVMQGLTGRNMYGLSHLVEHLGFRCTKDYTTDELMQALKREGVYNASTDHERINYWFKTTSQRMKTAINLVCNFGLNDLSLLTEEEFEIEKMTVYNEVKRYYDDDQTMFYFAVMPTLCGYSEEDNILGTTNTVAALTLDDARLIKNFFLLEGDNVFNVTYDPTVLDRDEIVAAIEAELMRFELKTTVSFYEDVKRKYYDSLTPPATGTFTIHNESEQAMTALLFDTMSDVNVIAARMANKYLADLSPTSMTDLIREKNGLTYGLNLYDDTISYKPYALFMCDVTKGTEDLMLQLLEQAVDESVERYNETAHNELLDMIRLKRTLAFINQERYDQIFWTALWFPEIITLVKDTFAADVDAAYRQLEETLASYENVRQYLDVFRSWVKERKYGKLTNLENSDV